MSGNIITWRIGYVACLYRAVMWYIIISRGQYWSYCYLEQLSESIITLISRNTFQTKEVKRLNSTMYLSNFPNTWMVLHCSNANICSYTRDNHITVFIAISHCRNSTNIQSNNCRKDNIDTPNAHILSHYTAHFPGLANNCNCKENLVAET